MAREESVYMAKLAEQAERYEEMVEFMEKVVAALLGEEELTVEEGNLLSVAYKNMIGTRRASWRIVSSIEQKEEGRGNEGHISAIRGYCATIESELTSICSGILYLLDARLVPSSSTSDSKVFYLKMKGDYHCYLTEFKTDAEHKDAAESTLTTYKAAQDIAVEKLPPMYPIRLGLGLLRWWDVKEDGDALYLRINMPGLGKEQVKVAVEQCLKRQFTRLGRRQFTRSGRRQFT